MRVMLLCVLALGRTRFIKVEELCSDSIFASARGWRSPDARRSLGHGSASKSASDSRSGTNSVATASTATCLHCLRCLRCLHCLHSGQPRVPRCVRLSGLLVLELKVFEFLLDDVIVQQ